MSVKTHCMNPAPCTNIGRLTKSNMINRCGKPGPISSSNRIRIPGSRQASGKTPHGVQYKVKSCSNKAGSTHIHVPRRASKEASSRANDQSGCKIPPVARLSARPVTDKASSKRGSGESIKVVDAKRRSARLRAANALLERHPHQQKHCLLRCGYAGFGPRESLGETYLLRHW